MSTEDRPAVDLEAAARMRRGAWTAQPRRVDRFATARGPLSRGAWPLSHGAWPLSHGAWPLSRGAWPLSRGAWTAEPRRVAAEPRRVDRSAAARGR